MKKTTIMIAAVLVSAVLCYALTAKKAEASDMKINLAKIAEVQKFPQSTIRLAYNTLSNEEKAFFWKMHVDQYVAKTDIDPKLKKYVLDLREIITPELYASLKTGENAAKIKQMNAEFEKVVNSNEFSKDQLIAVTSFSSMGVPEVSMNALENTAALVASECDCYYSISCSGSKTCEESQHCKDNGPFDCGLFGTSRCTGTCK